VDQDQFVSLFVPLREVPAVERDPNQPKTIRRFRLFESSGLRSAERRDFRLYLDSRALRSLLDQATSSPTGRVIIHGVEFEVEEREDRNGHRFFVSRFVGAAAPEWSEASFNLTASHG
jgi:hypothetical protein